jgi:hypothetical protein
MCRFDEQLTERLKGDVDLKTFEWIGDRLAETGPFGQHYMVKWRKQFPVVVLRELEKVGEKIEE